MFEQVQVEAEHLNVLARIWFFSIILRRMRVLVLKIYEWLIVAKYCEIHLKNKFSAKMPVKLKDLVDNEL